MVGGTRAKNRLVPSRMESSPASVASAASLDHSCAVKPAVPGPAAVACCSKLAICMLLTSLHVSTARHAGLAGVAQGASAPGSTAGSAPSRAVPPTCGRTVLMPSSKRSTAELPLLVELVLMLLAAAWSGDAPELQGFMICTGVYRLSGVWASVLASTLLVLPAANLSKPLCCEHSTGGRRSRHGTTRRQYG